MPPWKPPWKSMMDPGDVSSYFPQSFAGHPRDLALEYMAAGPEGTYLAAGVGSPLALALGGFQLKTSPNWLDKALWVTDIQTKDPSEGRSALKELIRRAVSGGFEKIYFSPVYGNISGGKRSMHDMVTEMAEKIGAQKRSNKSGKVSWNYWEVPTEKLVEYFGSKVKK